MLFTGGIAAVLSFVVIAFIFIKRKKITCMAGMMAAMALGMLAGLTGGLLAGISYNGNLFLSTILGMTFGFLAGFFAGMPISIMAIIDGVLSGVMGGMMGAMLGEMIAPEYQDPTVHIMLVLFVGMTCIVLYMLQQEAGFNHSFLINKLFHNPLWLAIALPLFFYLYNHLYNEFARSSDLPMTNSSLNHFMEDHNQAAPPLSIETKGKKVVIEATEFVYLPKSLQLTVGQPVTLILKNSGRVEHDIEFENMKASLLQRNDHENHAENANVHVHSLPGKTAEVTFIPIESGVFRFYCTVPGHKESGMVGWAKVS
ncbi:hypothetical protein B1690_12865 [Geobacillus sp. 46C-IIa]|uniref:plastocyanin/azurin family copper-binding protein n=1 Tax=Geobacillus sp. 46C-IIa TaxID=1963025 RepID=UPI0009BE4008|nr:plastocyanin/azurin family copper-binding protein [Geobacillus sp. 46C-IIa]OQP05531.1 hypothetical protein B1690_12865 [Geobacillus sp. 46C-IIa]QNU29729.1 hypothetical protein IC803_12640 [Geobacillus sp. 46C-IIa]